VCRSANENAAHAFGAGGVFWLLQKMEKRLCAEGCFLNLVPRADSTR